MTRLWLLSLGVVACATAAQPTTEASQELPPCEPSEPTSCKPACDHGVARACRLLGVAHARGDDAPLDPKRARLFLGRGCEAGDPQSCGELAGLVSDRGHATDLHRQACAGSFAKSCLMLGSIELQTGEIEAAVGSFERGCELGDTSSCQLAEDVRSIEQSRVEDCEPNDAKRCEELCARGSAESCARLARLLETDDSQDEAVKRAVRFHEMACARGASDSCTLLGRRYLAGQGVEPDVIEAKRWFGLGCTLGNAESCKLAEKWGSPK